LKSQFIKPILNTIVFSMHVVQLLILYWFVHENILSFENEWFYSVLELYFYFVLSVGVLKFINYHIVMKNSEIVKTIQNSRRIISFYNYMFLIGPLLFITYHLIKIVITTINSFASLSIVQIIGEVFLYLLVFFVFLAGTFLVCAILYSIYLQIDEVIMDIDDPKRLLDNNPPK
jgi:hypothetical protein